MDNVKELIVSPTQTKRRGFFGLLTWVTGWVALALGVLGVVLPLLPTAPFLVVAAACFAKTDPAMQARMMRLPVVGRYLDDIACGRELPAWMQFLSILFIWFTVLYATALIVKSVWVKIALWILAVLTTLHVLLLGRGRDSN